MIDLILLPGKEKSLQRFHPWIYSGAVSSVNGQAENGETIRVINSSGDFLAWAAYSHLSKIRARVWSWEREESIDRMFFRDRLASAIALRANTDLSCAVRLVYAEADNIPGLIIDRYGDALVIQFLSAGAEYWRQTIAELAMELTGATRVFERSDIEARRLEGLTDRSGLIMGDNSRSTVEFLENGAKFEVDIIAGQKTGFYLDQSKNRLIMRGYSSGCDALDCFCYTGGFTVNLLMGGAQSVLAVDSSANALAQAQKHVCMNYLDPSIVEFKEADVFRFLRELRDRNRSFDLIILDPPKFAYHTSQIERAARAYKDINLLAFKLLRPGGKLATFSCSGAVDEALFQKIVAGAAVDARVHAQIVEHFHQAQDHPIALAYPESAYLKGLLVKVV